MSAPDRSARTGLVFDDHRLAQLPTERLGHHATDDVGRGAGAEGNDDFQGARLRLCNGDAGSEQLLQRAEASARQALASRPVEELPHVAAWRAAYRAFGAKPQRTRNSLEALLRRAETGLPDPNCHP